jgi:uncharacterized protein YkwD
MRTAILALLLAVTLAGATAVSSWQTGTVSASVTKQLRGLIADEHQRACRTSLEHNAQLKWMARWKAMDMGLRNDLSHTPHVWDFYDQAGIPHRYGAGEILGVNGYPIDETAQAVFAGWLASPGHAGLIRNCDYDRFGVGVFRTKDQKWFAVEFTNV